MKKCSVLLVCLLGACAGSAKLTESQQYYVGRGLAANAIAKAPLVTDDPDLEAYVSWIGMTIALESDRPETFEGYHFGVLRNDRKINAFATPGGFIFVTTAALKAMKNEDELAAVLAHEIAHVNLRHPDKLADTMMENTHAMKILSESGHIAKTGAGIVGGILGGLGHSSAAKSLETVQANLEVVVTAFDGMMDEITKKLEEGFSQEFEREADRMAIDLLGRPGVGYDPDALAQFIGRLPATEGGIWETSSHPEHQDRVELIREEIAKSGKTGAINPARTKRFQAMTIKLRGGQ